MKRLFLRMLFARVLVEFTFQLAKWLIRKANEKKAELDEMEEYITKMEKEMNDAA